MNILVLDSIWSIVDTVDEGRTKLYDLFKYPVVKMIKIKGKLRRTVEYESMIGSTGYFFTGLLPLVQESFPDCTIAYQHRPIRYRVELSDSVGSFIFEPYQKDQIYTALKYRRGILDAITGTGKTVVAMGIIKALHLRPTLILLSSTDLLYQTQEVLQKTFRMPIGIIGDKKKDIQQITIALTQSLSKWNHYDIEETFKDLALVITDEAHHAQSNSYIDILKAIKCSYRIGLTGTPKEPQKNLGYYFKVAGILGPILHRVKVSDAPKRLVSPHLKILSYKQNPYAKYIDWPWIYEWGIVRNVDRNQKLLGAVRYYTARNKSVLIIVRRINHGEILQKMMPSLPFVQGKDDAETRRTIKQYVQGKAHAAISTTIFGEGVDMPELDVVIIAGGYSSDQAAIQYAGRVLRRTANKSEGIIIDFRDIGHTILKRHFYNRYKHYKERLQVIEI